MGRQELLVQCPCTHHRSIPRYAIRVAGTDGLTGFSALPTLSTTMPPPASHYRNTYTRAHTCLHPQKNLPVLSLTIQTNSTFSTWCEHINASTVLGHSGRRQGAHVGQCGGDGTVEKAPPSPFSSCWETLQLASLTVTLVLSAQPPPYH